MNSKAVNSQALTQELARPVTLCENQSAPQTDMIVSFAVPRAAAEGT